ncbi:MAG: hypothetical protein R3F02_11430 [Thiolinea sp.]
MEPMSQLTSGSYDLSIASLEIILLVAGAFIAGALLCYLLRLLGLCCRRRKSADREVPLQPVSNRSTQRHQDPIMEPILPQPARTAAPAISADNSSGYQADISSLIRSSGSDDNADSAAPLRTTNISTTAAPPVVSFEDRARASLAELRSSHAAEKVVDYTIDMPVPDDNHIDDLKKLEGIDSGIEKLLNEAGIKSYAKLATMDRDYLKELLESAGSKFAKQEPKSWPYQAELAAKDNWNRLQEYQEFLRSDRK